MKLKTCTECKLKKEITEFSARSDAPDKPRSSCKKCCVIRAIKSRSLRPKEVVKEYFSSYYKKNKEYFSLKSKKWIIENKDRDYSRHKKYNLENREKVLRCKRNTTYKQKYGITLSQKEEMISNQGFACMSCKIDLRLLPAKNVCIDHCHKSSKIRGILCRDCNLSLGLMKEDHKKIRMLSEYAAIHCSKDTSRC